jgi:iron-sulfur cluster repair protein YtfE (RIC family)
MSTTTHTEQLMLPGQTAAPAGPADMMLMYVMHHAFRRDLARFAEAVGVTPVEDRAAWKALGTRWDRFFQILHHHHTVEDDLIWPFLNARADADEQETLAAMEEEHGEIDPLLTSVADGLAALAGDRVPAGAEDLRAALKVRMAATRDALGRHLEHEETGAIPILQRHTTAESWKAIEEEIDKRKPPVSLGFIVGWCAEDVPAPQLDAVFAKVGLPFKVLWLLTRGRFRRGERQAFKYAA